MPGVRLIREGGVAERLSLVASRAVAVAAPAAAAPPFIPLTTTTQCPPVAKRRIRRQRLLHLLQGASEARLILIKGPAGFGKTTLAVQWSEELRAGGLNTAWLRAEQENCEPAVFLQYMAIALEQCLSRCRASGTAGFRGIRRYRRCTPSWRRWSMPSPKVARRFTCWLTTSIWSIRRRSAKLSAFCLKHAPRHFRIVLTAREVPALPLGTLRARGELFEIDAGVLRFSLEETESLLVSEGCPVTGQSAVAVLQNNTGGWAAALRMACSFLRAGVAPEAGLRSTPGGQHALESYLEEVLARLPREVYEFMLATSILKTLSPAMCEAVAGCSHSELLLDSLLQRYQLINLEDTGATYSYHPLVGDYLRQQLLRRSPARCS
jgi:LuxR family maltose regulon positive regulatory protein